LPVRKKNRLINFDYSRGGAYFVTICTQDRKRILSSIVHTNGPDYVGEGFALPQLTNIGQIAEYWMKNICVRFSNAELDKYVIMPNHIHMVLILRESDGRANPSPTVSSIIGWLKYNITRAADLKSGQRLFQRSFYDRIIRNRDEYMEICNYIYFNPLNWENDELYSL